MKSLGKLGGAGVLCALLTGCLVPFDFDADGKADVAYYLPDGTWWVAGEGESIFTSSDHPMPVTGDYDGDGRMAPAALLDDGRWETGDAGTIAFDPRAETDTPHENWVPVPGNYDEDRATEPAWFDELNALWFIQGEDDPIQFGQVDPIDAHIADVPVPADYDGDGDDDLAVYRPYDRSFYVQGEGKVATLPLGYPVPADYDGDGDDDPAVYRTFGPEPALHVQGQDPVPWPGGDEYAAPANYTGAPGDEFATVDDGQTDGSASFTVEGQSTLPLPDDARPAAVRPWYLQSVLRLTFYQQCDLDDSCPFAPVPYDFDGSGQADVAYQDGYSWYRSGESEPFAIVDAGGIAVAGDYDGDGRWDPAALTEDGDQWVIGNSWPPGSETSTVIEWDPRVPPTSWEFSWHPVPGDYDGDRSTEPAWFDPEHGLWYIYGQSEPVAFGRSDPGSVDRADIPVPADYDGDGDDDLAVYRPNAHSFHVQGRGKVATVGLGFPVPADYDGDGDDDPAVVGPDSSGGWALYVADKAPVALPQHPGEEAFLAPGDYTSAPGDEIAILDQSDNTFDIEGLAPIPVPSDAEYPAATRPWYLQNVLLMTWHIQCEYGDDSGCGFTVPYDFDDSGQADLAFVDWSGSWHRSGEAEPFFTSADPEAFEWAVAADYDGDAVWEPANVLSDGRWETGGDAGSSVFAPPPSDGPWGVIPVPADYTGDRATERAWYRVEDATWFIEGQSPVQFGVGSDEDPVYFDIPVPGHYLEDESYIDRDADLAVYRPADGTFHVMGAGQIAEIALGLPVPSFYAEAEYDVPAVLEVHNFVHVQFESGPSLSWDDGPDVLAPAPADYNAGVGDEFAAWGQPTCCSPMGTAFVQGSAPYAEPSTIEATAAAMRPYMRANVERTTFIQGCLAQEGTVVADAVGQGFTCDVPPEE